MHCSGIVKGAFLVHITQESDYAVRIVYCLAREARRMDARTISEQMAISLRFSLKILGKLAQSGLVVSYKGNRGGYELSRPAAQITLRQVIEAVEGPYRLSRCLGEDAGECSRGASGCCAFQRVFGRISGTINRELEAVNFEMLLRDAEHLPDQKPASEAENPAAAVQ